ncbi:MAG: UvrD-helicase domain-containing protein, partial [Rhodospirillales bacterium]|nr:UvrD-helicase domain-containing protein [Rhodospirillales bacterium]
RRHAEAVGLNSNFTILDTDDQLRLLKQVMEAERIDAKRFPAQSLMAMIQRWKDKGLIPDMLGAEDGKEAGGQAVQLYAQYQQRLKTLNACDFGDLLLHCLTIFRRHEDILTEYQNRFRYILVDEYQDTNIAQYLWLRLLAQKHRNICCVGDDDQSIYSWRGAEVGNILKFDKDFPGAKVVRLERNYRSTPNILATASGLIANNAVRLGKALHAGAGIEAGAKVKLRGVYDDKGEARIVVDEIEALERDGLPLSSMAILVRAGSQTREFEERMVAEGVPYRVVGGLRFYERQEIRDALAYLRLIVEPAHDLAFERIVNVPKRGLGEATMQAVHVVARRQFVPLLKAAALLCETDELKPKARKAMGGLVADILRWRDMLEGMPPGELVQTVLDESGYTAMWQADTKSPEAQGRLENLKELVSAIEEYDSLPSFLEHVALVMENEEKTETARVTVMTLHGAKGLEFDAVFLPGWEEGLFPHQRSLDQNGAEGLEEERRLAYVGITRARRRVMISYAANRRIYNQWQATAPSRFIQELPVETLDASAEPGLSLGRFHGGYGEDSGWSRGRTIEGTAWTAPPSKAGSSYEVGDRVFHEKFGYGSVQAV